MSNKINPITSKRFTIETTGIIIRVSESNLTAFKCCYTSDYLVFTKQNGNQQNNDKKRCKTFSKSLLNGNNR